MLADLLNKIAADTQETSVPYKPRPSAAGPERCLRALVYQALGAPPQPLPGRTIAVFDDGRWHEELVKDWIRKSAYRLHSEQMEILTPVGIGHIDGMVTDLAGQDFLLEIKSSNHFGFQRMRDQWPLDYFTQVALYLHGLQKIDSSVSQGLLLVKNKNTSDYLEFLLTYKLAEDVLTLVNIVVEGETLTRGIPFEAVTRHAVEKFRLVEEYRSRHQLPPRPFEFGTVFPCGYCGWSKTCWQEYEKEFSSLSDSVELDPSTSTLVEHYRFLRTQETSVKKEKEKARREIVAWLLGKKARRGFSGKTTVEIQTRSGGLWLRIGGDKTKEENHA